MMADGDLVEFKTGFRAPWRPGYIEAITAHVITVRAALGRQELVTIHLGGPGRKGKVREVSGARCVGLVERIDGPTVIDGAFANSAGLPTVTARLGIRPRPVSREPAPARCPAYRAYVRQHPCALCGAAAPNEAHHEGERGVGQRCSDFLCVPLCLRCHRRRTDAGAVPAEAAALLLRAQLRLLAAWAEREAHADGRLARVPVLRLVAVAR